MKRAASLLLAALSSTATTWPRGHQRNPRRHELRNPLAPIRHASQMLDMSGLLSQWGHEVQTAHDGRHALTAARNWQPEFNLLDMGLPGMDGYEIARRLREEPATLGAFLVALTGYGQDEDRPRAQA